MWASRKPGGSAVADGWRLWQARGQIADAAINQTAGYRHNNAVLLSFPHGYSQNAGEPIRSGEANIALAG
jgi:hypothetical protein